MIKPLVRTAVLAGLSILVVACQGQVKVKLDNSIGLATYDNLGLIEQKPIGIGLVVGDDVRNAVTEAVVQAGVNSIRYTMPVGEALATRLATALVFQFQRVQLLKEPVLPSDGSLDALMIVKIKDLDTTVKISPKWNTVSTESSGWIEVEATLKDRDNNIVWIGTSRAEAEAAQESIMVVGSQDAGVAVSQAIEKTVAKLVAQMAASSSLREFIARSDQES